MSIASVTAPSVPSPSVPVPSVLLGTTGPATMAASTAGAFGATLQTTMAGQSAGDSDPLRTAYQTEPGRGTPGSAHRHHHHLDGGASDATGTATAQGESGTAATATAAANSQTSGELLLSDMLRGLQAYGATIPVG